MTEPTDRALELAGDAMPTPRTIRGVLRAQLNAAVTAERTRRGVVAVPEDTYSMQRSLAAVVEVCGEYSRAFAEAGKEARQIAEEELIEAFGEQNGVPNQGVTVPDAEGDVKIGLDTMNARDFDKDALFSAVAFEAIESLDAIAVLGKTYDAVSGHGCVATEDTASVLASLLTLAMERLTDLGKFEPQITKVNKFVKDIGRMDGADGVVASVTSSITTRRIYKGVTVERVIKK